MLAGLLEHRILVEKPELITDEYGAETTVWEILKQTRSSVKIDSGSRTNENNEIFHDYKVTFTVRYYHTDITEDCRIIWKGKKYRILNIFPDQHIQRILISTELINE